MRTSCGLSSSPFCGRRSAFAALPPETTSHIAASCLLVRYSSVIVAHIKLFHTSTSCCSCFSSPASPDNRARVRRQRRCKWRTTPSSWLTLSSSRPARWGTQRRSSQKAGSLPTITRALGDQTGPWYRTMETSQRNRRLCQPGPSLLQLLRHRIDCLVSRDWELQPPRLRRPPSDQWWDSPSAWGRRACLEGLR